MDLNKVFILGRLTADPQVKTIPSGNQVANFSVATNRVYTDKSGVKQKQTEYHNIVVWGRQAEIAGQFLKKGSSVLIEGRLSTRSYADKQNQNHKVTEIIAERIQLGPKSVASSKKEDELIDSSLDNNQNEIPTIDLEESSSSISPEDIPF